MYRDYTATPSTAKSTVGRNLKFEGYVYNYKIVSGNILGLILKNKMAAIGVSLLHKSSHKAVCGDYPVTPSRAKYIIGLVINFAGLFFIIKACPGIFLPSF